MRVGRTYLAEAEEVVVCGQHYHRIYLVFVYVDQILDCVPYWHISHFELEVYECLFFKLLWES